MTKKDDLICALQNEKPPECVPLWELEFHAWNQASNRKLILGGEFQRLNSREKERALHLNAELFLSVSERLHFAALTLPNTYWEIGRGVAAYYWLPEEAIFELARILTKHKPDDIMLVANCSAFLGMPFGEDYIPFSYKLFDSPEEIDRMAQEKLSEGLRLAKRFRDCGVEIGLSTTDLADNHGTYMNPGQLERFVWPYLDSWSQQLYEMGMYTILHSDGNLNACLDIIADSGINALQAIDPTAAMDIFDVKIRIGNKICLCGNLDCAVLVSGTPEEVYAASVRLLNGCKEGGGFVFGSSNAVQQEVRIENYLALIQAWEAYGKY